MPSNAQFITRFLCWLWILNLTISAPAVVQRQRRQSSSVNSNPGDTKDNVVDESTTTSWLDSPLDINSDANSFGDGNEGMAFNFENATTSWDPVDKAPVVDDTGIDPGIFWGYDYTNTNESSNDSYPDYVGDDYPLSSPEGNGGSEDENSHHCEKLCELQCLFGACNEPECVNYTCDYTYYDSYNYPAPSDDIESNDSQKQSNVSGETTTLRPFEERRCNSSAVPFCVHGVCRNGKECTCDEGWISLVCNVPCTLECDQGNCQVKPKVLSAGKPWNEITEEDMFCNCKPDYYKERCDEKIPDNVAIAEAKGRKLAIILGSCLTFAILTSIILPVILWRKRVIFVMRVVYFFKMWEDDDGKTHDAYISAGTTDKALKFVKNVLAPKLEQQGFKLYIPSRDQLCGAVISEDVITAIKQSRRTIMVVTPEYLQNDWSGFEVLNAQVEMIKLQQRIIPIILEDVSQEAPRMRKSLKHIMESVKCLKVPGYKSTFTNFEQTSSTKKKIDKFWHRLQLTMPKKKALVSSDESKCYIKEDTYSTSVPDSKINADQNEVYDSIEVNVGYSQTKNYDTMMDSKINPLSVYQISSSNQEIDISKYEQCFNFKTAL